MLNFQILLAMPDIDMLVKLIFIYLFIFFFFWGGGGWGKLHARAESM